MQMLILNNFGNCSLPKSEHLKNVYGENVITFILIFIINHWSSIVSYI